MWVGIALGHVRGEAITSMHSSMSIVDTVQGRLGLFDEHEGTRVTERGESRLGAL